MLSDFAWEISESVLWYNRDMSQLILKIVNENWGLVGPECWTETIWHIYDDKTVEREDRYMVEKKNRWSRKVLPSKAYASILRNIDNIKNGKDFTDRHVVALDGDAWSYTQYEDGHSIWSRELGHIYGIYSLEKIAEIL